MTISSDVGPSGRDTFAVLPVVDYEPPAQDVPRTVAQRRQSSQARVPRRTAHAPRRPYTGQPKPPGAMSAPMRQAAVFADAALRRVLEVIDRRRSPAQLRPMLAPGLLDSVLFVGRAGAGHPGGPQGAAVLRRMRLQPAGHRDPETAAEVFGTYSRGDRIHAIACRVEQVHAGDRRQWLVVALHIG